jgi:hypothetical protein
MHTLSIFFSADHTYLTIVEDEPKGLKLKYIKSTSQKINLLNPSEESSISGKTELDEILSKLPYPVEQLVVTIPAENVLVSKFPGQEDISMNNLRKLVELEIKQNFPQFNYSDFSSTVVPLSPGLDGKQMMMGIIISKDVLASCTTLLKKLELPIKHIEISQLNTHSAYIYNYPEQADKTVAFFGIKNRFIDISVIQNKKPFYYNLVSYKDSKKICDICQNEFKLILSEYVKSVDLACFFGYGLNSDIFSEAKIKLADSGTSILRLNAFRMMSSDISNREKEYCSRTAHIYPPCIGGCIPFYHERIKLI